MNNKEKVLNAIENKNLVKVISGIRNYNNSKVLDVVMAADRGDATAVDICDDLEIIKSVREITDMPIFVSSIDAEKLIAAQEAGVEVLEVGNFEGFYLDGREFSKEEVLEITKKVKENLKEGVLLSSTIPGNLSIADQIELAKEFVALGVDIIQSEGYSIKTPSTGRLDKTYLDIIKSSSTLTNTFEINKAVSGVDIMTASGITATTAPLAISMGACGVGVGTYITSQDNKEEMIAKVKELVDSINGFSISHREHSGLVAV